MTRLFCHDNLTSTERPPAAYHHSSSMARTVLDAEQLLEDERRRAWRGWRALDGSMLARRLASTTCATSTTSLSCRLDERVGRTRASGYSRATKVYVVQTVTEGRRALRAHDHRPWRPRPRPDLRQRHHRVCRRAVGPRWITIDTSRVALALARTRLMSAVPVLPAG